MVGWEAPDGSRIWSISPDPARAGWMPHYSDLMHRFEGGMPEEAARFLVRIYDGMRVLAMAADRPKSAALGRGFEPAGESREAEGRGVGALLPKRPSE